MSTRTRLWLLAATAILIGYPLAAWIIGFIVQEQVQAREQAALQRAGPYFTVEERTYRRGVFGATEVVTFGIDTKGLKTPAAAALIALSSYRLTARNTLHHGPFPGGRTFALATIDTELVLPAEAQKDLDALFPGQKPYTLRTSLGWLGGYRIEFSSPPASGEPAPGTTIRSGGMSGTATVTRGQQSIALDFSAKGLGASTEEFQAQLDDVRVKSVKQRAFGSLRLGDSSVSIGRLEAHRKAPEQRLLLSVQSLQIIDHSSATGDYLSYSGKLGAGPVQAAKLTATREQLEYTATHIHGPSLAHLVDSLRGVANAAPSAPSADQLQRQFWDAVRSDGIELLLHDPVIEIPHLDYDSPQGAFRLSARLTAPELKREDLERGSPALVAALTQHLQANADIRIDTGLLDKMTEGTPGNGDRLAIAARQLEAQGYIAHEGNALTTHLRFDHGKLSLDGKSFPPSRASPQP